MKTFTFQRLMKCAVLLAVLSLCSGAYAENRTNAAARIAPPVLVKSTFVSDSSSGKDPFFPNSTRRIEVIEQPTQTNNAPQPSTLFNQLALKGISGTRAQPLALINSSTVGVGELAEIRCGRQIIKIRCLEIRDRSVLIALDGTGETRELKLRDSI
jgi:hypothetical protein